MARSAAPDLTVRNRFETNSPSTPPGFRHVGHRPREGVVQIDSAGQTKLCGQQAGPAGAENLRPHIGWIGDHGVEAGREPRVACCARPAGRGRRKSPSTSVELVDGQAAETDRLRVDGRADRFHIRPGSVACATLGPAPPGPNAASRAPSPQAGSKTRRSPGGRQSGRPADGREIGPIRAACSECHGVLAAVIFMRVRSACPELACQRPARWRDRGAKVACSPRL